MSTTHTNREEARIKPTEILKNQLNAERFPLNKAVEDAAAVLTQLREDRQPLATAQLKRKEELIALRAEPEPKTEAIAALEAEFALGAEALAKNAAARAEADAVFDAAIKARAAHDEKARPTLVRYTQQFAALERKKITAPKALKRHPRKVR